MVFLFCSHQTTFQSQIYCSSCWDMVWRKEALLLIIHPLSQSPNWLNLTAQSNSCCAKQ